MLRATMSRPETLVLAIDVGTQSVRAAAFDVIGGARSAVQAPTRPGDWRGYPP
jgi:sugar (pentulose or hexulose) kinase